MPVHSEVRDMVRERTEKDENKERTMNRNKLYARLNSLGMNVAEVKKIDFSDEELVEFVERIEALLKK
jgi:predicted ATP-grasp superfamily ATP-dependent carboligase